MAQVLLTHDWAWILGKQIFELVAEDFHWEEHRELQEWQHVQSSK